jgi:uncharacterized protein YdeI (YjbR/CyaY-like superfamily)
MSTRDPRVDAYIAKSAEFAQPILIELRKRIHAACPDAVEVIKWSMPHFEYNGRPLCNFAAFKQHCAFGFWHGSDVLGSDADRSAMGQYGRIESLKDLPAARVMRAQAKKAMALIDSGERPARAKKAPRPAAPVPEDLRAALARNRAARTTFEGFSNTNRREYIEWLTGARQEATRARRLATTLEWLAEGKPRNWKYQKC